MHKPRNLFRAKTAQKEFRVSVFALFLCASCYRIFILQQPLLYYSISVVRQASIFRWKKARDTEELRRKAVAALITHGFCHLCNAQIRGNQQMLCVVDALADDVFRYAAPNRFLESSFQLRGAHESNFGKLFQRYPKGIVVVDVPNGGIQVRFICRCHAQRTLGPCAAPGLLKRHGFQHLPLIKELCRWAETVIGLQLFEQQNQLRVIHTAGHALKNTVEVHAFPAQLFP